MHITMVHDRGFMGDTIKLEYCLQQKSSQKGVLQFLQKIRKFKMAVIFGKKFVQNRLTTLKRYPHFYVL